MADLSSPPLDQRDGQRVGGERLQIDQCRPGGKRRQLFSYECRGPLDLEPANVRASEDVAGVPAGKRDLREAEDAGRELVADVLLQAARAGDGPDEPER